MLVAGLGSLVQESHGLTGECPAKDHENDCSVVTVDCSFIFLIVLLSPVLQTWKLTLRILAYIQMGFLQWLQRYLNMNTKPYIAQTRCAIKKDAVFPKCLHPPSGTVFL